MTIPENIVFVADVEVQSYNEMSGTELCFACAVRFVMAGHKVSAHLQEDSPHCWNETCQEGGIPKVWVSEKIAPPPVDIPSLGDDIPF